MAAVCHSVGRAPSTNPPASAPAWLAGRARTAPQSHHAAGTKTYAACGFVQSDRPATRPNSIALRSVSRPPGRVANASSRPTSAKTIAAAYPPRDFTPQ